MAKQRMTTTAPCDINETSAPVVKKSKPVRRTEEGLRARKESDRLRVKTRINISYCFKRWRKLKEDMHLRTDGDVANYLLNFYEQRSSISLTSTVEHMQEPTALSSLGHVSASERSTASELFLECEEEELEPWQKQISHVRVKMENDDEEFSNDQIDCKPKLSLLQGNALRSNTEFIGSLGVQCRAGNSITIVPVSQQQLFQKMVTPKVKEEAYDPISNPVSLSSVQSPVHHTPSSNQLQSDQSSSQTLPVPFPLPCFTVLKSTETSKKQ